MIFVGGRMLSHDDCLKIIRDQFKEKAVISSYKFGDKYCFRLSNSKPPVKAEFGTFERTVNEKTGAVEIFDSLGYALTHPDDSSFEEESDKTFRWIDGKPGM